MSDARWFARVITALAALAMVAACDGGVVCGAGTVARDGACVLAPPAPSCAAGTTFDPATLEFDCTYHPLSG